MATDRPAFIIGGAPRSGTTYLAEALDRHPSVYVAKPFIPEPKVFMTPADSPAGYFARYAGLFAEAPSAAVCGEKTSYYLENHRAFELIRDLLPDVKILFIVREPVGRAYSNYLWTKKNGLETLSFEDAIEAEGTRPDPLPAEKSYARPFDYLTRADYAALGQPYVNTLGCHRVRFVVYEDLITRPAELMGEIQEFIGVDPIPFETLDVGIINSAKDVGPEIDPETERRLRRRMAPLVQSFVKLTGLDVSAWRYDSVRSGGPS